MPIKLIRITGRPNFYLRGTIRGRSVFETTGTADQAAAEEIRIKKEAEILHESIHGKRLTKSFAEAADAYLSAPGASENVERFILPLDEHFGRKMLHEITQDEIDAYVRLRYAGKASATVLRNVVTPLTAVLNFAARRKWCDAPSFERPADSRGSERWASYDEASALLSAAAPHIQPLLLTFLYTAARMSELLDLVWDDVDLDRRWAVFRDTKNDTSRGVPLHAAVVAELGALPRSKADPHVFLTPAGERYFDSGREAGGQIKSAWRGACVRAGLARWDYEPGNFRARKLVWIADRIVPHHLRHTCATWLLMAGVDTRTRDEILGHKPGEMGPRYAHVPVPRLVDAIDRLPAVSCAKSVRYFKNGRIIGVRKFEILP